MKRVRRKVRYRGSIFRVEEWRLPKTGTMFARVTGHDAVAVLPVLNNGRILLERQYRHALDKYLYEIPAGHINRGEKPEAAARRELEEETGYRAGRLTRLSGFYEAPGSYTQYLHLYLAEGLEKSETRRELNEIIELKEVTLAEALRMVRSNRIMDAKTICGILYYFSFVKK